MCLSNLQAIFPPGPQRNLARYQRAGAPTTVPKPIIRTCNPSVFPVAFSEGLTAHLGHMAETLNFVALGKSHSPPTAFSNMVLASQ
jgi:hypothetical protein